MSTDRRLGAVPEPEAVLGQALRALRKRLGLSAVSVAEAAGISRVTLHRLEKGETSVSLGAALAVARALGAEVGLAAGAPEVDPIRPDLREWLPLRVRLADFPELRHLAWQLGDAVTELSPREAFGLYERNWRHVQVEALQESERELIAALRQVFGEGVLRV